MYIEEVKEGEECGEKQVFAGGDHCESTLVAFDTKRVLVGAGARALFYPTLLYNVVRNKVQSEFRWWDRVDEFILLGAVPFSTDVPRLKELGVGGVVTLNEPYETLVSTSLYNAHNIKHLVIPTRDYLFAPSFGDISQAVDFIHENASCGKTTYVHCKAGRGRSTTVVLCYLVEHKQMTPDAAYDYVKSIRPRVRLASSQWQAVQDYYHCRKKNNFCPRFSSDTSLVLPANQKPELFDDGSVVLVTKSDLDGYDESLDSGVARNVLDELSVACRLQLTSHATIDRLSCIWLRCYAHKLSGNKFGSCDDSDKLGRRSVDMQVC